MSEIYRAVICRFDGIFFLKSGMLVAKRRRQHTLLMCVALSKLFLDWYVALDPEVWNRNVAVKPFAVMQISSNCFVSLAFISI